MGLIGRPSPDLRARELSHIDCGSTIIAPRHLVAHVSGEPVLILLHQSGRKSDWAWLSNQNAPPKMLCGNFSNITLDSSQMGNYALFNDVFRSGGQKPPSRLTINGSMRKSWQGNNSRARCKPSKQYSQLRMPWARLKCRQGRPLHLGRSLFDACPLNRFSRARVFPPATPSRVYQFASIKLSRRTMLAADLFRRQALCGRRARIYPFQTETSRP